jgi:YfiH family protein
MVRSPDKFTAPESDLTSHPSAANVRAMHGPAPRLAPIEAPALSLPGITHAFFTRAGGVSTGLYAGLNTGIGSGDARANVLENRRRAVAYLGAGGKCLATPYQVHGTDTIVVETAWAPGRGPKADAVVTARPGIAVGVGTADCGPVLLADPAACVVAAAHAGWKGALAGILEATVDTMERVRADRTRIVAVLGPTISREAYEVGPEFVARFEQAAADNAQFFRPSSRAAHAFFDLPAYIVTRLERAGIGVVHQVGLCTYRDEVRFYSFRRATHRGEPDYGRLLSAIALTEQ